METKSTLFIYRNFKTEMREEDYQGGEDSALWLRARINCIRFRENQWREDLRENCRLCQEVPEDLTHFVLECSFLECDRREAVELQRPWRECRSDAVGQFLFGEENIERKKRILHMMWKKRRRKMEEISEADEQE